MASKTAFSSVPKKLDLKTLLGSFIGPQAVRVEQIADGSITVAKLATTNLPTAFYSPADGLLRADSSTVAGKVLFGVDATLRGVFAVYTESSDTVDKYRWSAARGMEGGPGGSSALDSVLYRAAAGRWAFSAKGTAAPVAGDFTANEQVMITRASDTSLRFSLIGSDGVVRSGTLAVA